jgi:hypothetical protein
MPFQPGHKLSTGRPKGALNRSTEEMKLSIARATNRALNNLPNVLEQLMKDDPKSAIDLAIKLLEFNLPKLSRTEMRAEIEQKIQQVQININNGNINQHRHNEDISEHIG